MDEFKDSTEEWRSIPEWEELYEVSNQGRIRRLHKTTPPRIVKASLNRFGYYEIGLKRHTQRRQTWIFVHRLVARPFIGPLPNGHQVNHKDGIKTNNSPDNLEYVTPRENIQHGQKLGLMNTARGIHAGFAKVTDEIVRSIRISNDSLSTIGRQWGITAQTVWAIKHRVTWKHVE